MGVEDLPPMLPNEKPSDYVKRVEPLAAQLEPEPEPPVVERYDPAKWDHVRTPYREKD